VSTSVVNEVLEEALSWHTPPTTRQGKQGKIYYGTQVSTKPPTFALFVNNPAVFKDNYRRYVERQFREVLGFAGTPLKIFWRGKKVREAERGGTANRATRV
jgi:GTPase